MVMGMVVDGEVVHALPGQVDVPPGGIIVDVREADLQSVRIGKETAFRPGVRHLEIVPEMVADIPQCQGGIGFPTGRIAQRTVFQGNPVGVVLDPVRGDPVIGIIRSRQVQAPVEMVLPPLQPGRYPCRQVVAAPEQVHAPLKGLHGQVIGIDAQDPADGVGAVHQRTGALDDLDPVHGELVDFQSVVVSPLLPLMLDPVHCDGDPVESKTADGGFGLSGADGTGLHAGDGAQTLHEGSGEIVLDIVPAHFHAAQGQMHEFLPLRLSIDGRRAQYLGGVLYLQHEGSQDGCNHVFLFKMFSERDLPGRKHRRGAGLAQPDDRSDERPAQEGVQEIETVGRRQDDGGQGNDKGKSQEMAQETDGKTTVIGTDVSGMRKMMDAFRAFRRYLEGFPVRMEDRRNEGRQEHCQQNQGKDAPLFLHNRVKDSVFSYINKSRHGNTVTAYSQRFK